MLVENNEKADLSLIEMINKGVDYWNENRPDERQRGGITSRDKYLDLSDQDFCNKDLSRIDFENTNLENSKFDGTNLTGSILIRVTTNEHTSFKGAKLDKSVFNNSSIIGADFEGATFLEADLSDCTFGRSKFKNADLTEVKVNSRTRFDSINDCEKCKVDKGTLNSLAKNDGNIGGLHSSELKKMVIADDFGKLKLSFSGFWKSLHIISLSFFAFPYAFFLFKLWSISYGLNLFDPTPTTETIGELFWEYVYSAGALDGRYSHLSLIALALVFYNCCRVVLLWKTITLEHQENVSGLPSDFRLNIFWGILYKIVTVGVVVNLMLISINTFNFLSRPLMG